jgi:hypothetical protein
MARSTSWAERLAASDELDIRPVPEGRRSMTPGASMLYPSARMVHDAIREIPAGETVSPKELRVSLAERYGAEYTCPVTTTMMLRIVAEAANEARQNGADPGEVPPVWRVLDAKTSAMKKLSFDPAWILEERARET